MAERTAPQRALCGGRLAADAYRPRLGDLALDLAADSRIGVVVGLPGEFAQSYHLRTPGGGIDWRAKGDGTTLRPVSVPVTHATPGNGGARYDAPTGTAAFPITVHHADGGVSDSSLVLTCDEVARWGEQFAALLAQERSR